MEIPHQKIRKLFLLGPLTLLLASMAWYWDAAAHRADPAPAGPRPISGTGDSTAPFLAPAQGDLVFRTGTGFWTPFFAAANKTHGYSHVGVLVREGGKFFVLHAEANDFTLEGGVIKTPLETFTAESVRYTLRRNEMPAEVKARFVSALEDMFRLQIGFDPQFELDDQGQKVYCTEFIWLAANRAGVSDLGQIDTLSARTFVLVDSIYASPRLGQSYRPGGV